MVQVQVPDHGTLPTMVKLELHKKTHTSRSYLLECCPVKCMLCFQETIFDVQMSGNEYIEM